MKKFNIFDHFSFICLCLTLFCLSLVCNKYLELRKAYKTECQEKIRYCRDYHTSLELQLKQKETFQKIYKQWKNQD